MGYALPDSAQKGSQVRISSSAKVHPKPSLPPLSTSGCSLSPPGLLQPSVFNSAEPHRELQGHSDALKEGGRDGRERNACPH